MGVFDDIRDAVDNVFGGGNKDSSSRKSSSQRSSTPRGTIDTDGDGQPDASTIGGSGGSSSMPDSGSSSTPRGATDTDGDGQPDASMPSKPEGAVDTDGDGQPDASTVSPDSSQDSQTSQGGYSQDPEASTGGYSSPPESSGSGSSPGSVDTDGDGQPDASTTRRSSSNTQGNQGGNTSRNGQKNRDNPMDFFSDTNPDKTAKYYNRISEDKKPRSQNQPDNPPGPTATSDQIRTPEEQKEKFIEQAGGDYKTTKELREEANLDSSEALVLETQATMEDLNKVIDENLGPKLEDVQEASPVDVPYFDLKALGTGTAQEVTDSTVSLVGLGAGGMKVLQPLDITKGDVVDYSKDSQGNVELNFNPENLKAPDVQESAERVSEFSDVVGKGGSQFVNYIKENPEKGLSSEVYPELIGGLVGGVSVTTSTTSKSPSYMNIQVQDSYLPKLENAKGETLKTARIKEGAGSRNTGAETSTGRSATQQSGEKAQSQGEQPAVYGKVEYQVDGESVTEDYIGDVKTSTETETTSTPDSQNPMDRKEIKFEKEGDATVDLEQIGQDGEVGADVVQDSQDQIVIGEIQAEGKTVEDPVMVQADPDGDVQVGFEKETVESGEVGGDQFTSVTEETGIRDLETGTEKTTSTTVTGSKKGSGKVTSENVKIDSDQLPDPDQVRDQSSGTSSSSSSSSDLYGDSDLDATDSSIADEIMGDQDSTTSTDTDSSSQDSDFSNFERSDYDSSGSTDLGQVQIRDSDSSTSATSTPGDSSTVSESMRKALKDKVSEKNVDVTETNVNVNVRGAVAQDDLQVNDVDPGLEEDIQGTGQDQRKVQDDIQDQVQDEGQDQDTRVVNDSKQSSVSSSSFSYTSSRSSESSIRDLDIGFDDDSGDPVDEESDVLKGEKNREYRASLDAVILGITGDKESYDLGTRPVIEENGNGKTGEKKDLQIDTKDPDLSI